MAKQNLGNMIINKTRFSDALFSDKPTWKGSLVADLSFCPACFSTLHIFASDVRLRKDNNKRICLSKNQKQFGEI